MILKDEKIWIKERVEVNENSVVGVESSMCKYFEVDVLKKVRVLGGGFNNDNGIW